MYAAKSDIRPAAPTSAPNHAAADARRGLQLRAARDHASFEAQERALSPAAGGVQGAASEGVRGASAPLPHLAAIQASFGRHDVSGVRAQVGGPAAAASRAIGASAYATGDRVGFSGGPSLHTAAHEAAHVVQQRAGVSLYGGVGRSGDVYERHADRVADLVVQGKSAESCLDELAGSGGGGGAAVQREEPTFGPLADGFVPAAEAESEFEVEPSAPAEPQYQQLPYYSWEENGVTVKVPESRYEESCTERLRALARGPVAEMAAKAKEAEILYDHFKELNKDQRVVAWIAEHLGRVELPPRAVIQKAGAAAKTATNAAKGKGVKGLRKTYDAIEQGEAVINKTVEVMRAYHEGVIKGVSFGITALKVTAAVSFTIAGACLTATLAPMLVPIATEAGLSATAAAGTAKTAAGVVAAMATARTSNVAKQGSEMAFGLREDFSFDELGKAMLYEGAAAVVAGPVAGMVAGRVAGPLATQLSKQLGRKITEEAVLKVLNGSFNRAFRGILSDTLTAVTDPEKMTMKTFLKDLARNLIAGGIAGALTANAKSAE